MIIFRSLSKEIYTYLLSIVVILLCILITNQFVHYLKDAADGKITILAVMQLMALQVPLLLGYMLPLAFFLSVLLVLGRWYIDNEITVLFSCGLSRAKLFGMVIILASFVSIFVAGIMLYLEPKVEQYRSQVIETAITEAVFSRIIPKRFQNVAGKGIFYVDSVHHKQFNQVFWIQQTTPNSTQSQNPALISLAAKAKKSSSTWNIMLAKSANRITLQHAPYLAFNNGHQYSVSPGNKAVSSAAYQQYAIALPHSADASHRDWPFNAPTRELWQLRHSNTFAAALLHWRLAMPISVLVLTILALALSKVNPRSSRFKKLLPAIILYAVYADLLFFGRSWIHHGLISYRLGLWWLHGMMLTIAIVLLLLQIYRFPFRFGVKR